MWGFRSNRLAIAVPQPTRKVHLLEEEDGHGHHLLVEEEPRSYLGCLDSRKGLKLGLTSDSS